MYNIVILVKFICIIWRRAWWDSDLGSPRHCEHNVYNVYSNGLVLLWAQSERRLIDHMNRLAEGERFHEILHNQISHVILSRLLFVRLLVLITVCIRTCVIMHGSNGNYTLRLDDDEHGERSAGVSRRWTHHVHGVICMSASTIAWQCHQSTAEVAQPLHDHAYADLAEGVQVPIAPNRICKCCMTLMAIQCIAR